MNIQKFLTTIFAALTMGESSAQTELPVIDAWILEGFYGLSKVELPTGRKIVSLRYRDVILTDIALDTSGQLYGASQREFYRIDTRDAHTTLIGEFDVNEWIDLIEFRHDNVLFGASRYALYQIDPTTAKTRKVFTFQRFPISMQFENMVIDRNGNFYISGGFGDLTQIQSDFQSWKYMGSGGTWSLDGIMYATDNLLYGFEDSFLGDFLYTIDLSVDPLNPTGNNLAKRVSNEIYTNRYSNVKGSTRNPQSFSLPSEWLSVITSTPPKPTYTEGPEKLRGKENLIVVTHGWVPPWESLTDTKWLDDMTNVLTQYLVQNNKNDWQVHEHRWLEKAWVPVPDMALNNAKQEGINLGNHLSIQNWDHVHLIGNSAGAGLIQTCAEVLNSNSPNTTVQCTFLDPFVGSDKAGITNYGRTTTWSDNYSSVDYDTYDKFVHLTTGTLSNAYNVDVTFLDPNKFPLGTYRSSWDGSVEECYRTITSHDWPRQFYFMTMIQLLREAEGFGFSLSKEGGNWRLATNQYANLGNVPKILGTPDPSCVPDTTIPEYKFPILNFTDLLSAKSQTGKIDANQLGLTLTTGSPVWFAVKISPTNAINFISFEKKFMNNGDGLLSVYWDTNNLGSFDQTVTSQGNQKHSCMFPRTGVSDAHILSFHLHSFSEKISSVVITNVSIGLAGIPGPFSLSPTTLQMEGLPVIELNGPPNFNYSVEVSTNLIDWEITVVLVNTNGVVRFVDRKITNSTARFYRAVGP